MQDMKTASTTLNPGRFTSYQLVSREPVSSTGSLFTIKPPKSDGSNLKVYEDAWNTGVWSVMFKQPQLQIGRDYTPLPPTSANEDDECLRFFIRKDPFGEVSRYLHSLKIGARIEVRGPRIECEIPPDTDRILFIAGGTGIAPALQAGHTLLRRTDHIRKPTIHILWANRQRQDCAGGYNETTDTTAETRMSWLYGLFGSSKSVTRPAPAEVADTVEPSLIVREIEALKAQYPEQVTVQYFVDEESSFIGKKTILECTKTAVPSSPDKSKRNLIFVSGPEGFISYMAGPKLWAQGMELQGPLQGIIKELDLQDWAVWKL
jgi:NAD(P)H-flavin reductase